MRDPGGGLRVRATGTALCLVLVVVGGCTESHSLGGDAAVGDARPGCPSGETMCGVLCVDTSSDDLHCGTCATTCGAGERCVRGTCAASCAAPLVACGSTCVDTRYDPHSCGACGHACAAGEYCASGTCAGATTCSYPQTACLGVCVDTDTDVANCGACGAVCPTGATCDFGSCTGTCTAGGTVCGTSCVDVQTDAANCGYCGFACASSERCSAGECVMGCGTLTVCGADCADLSTSAANCGACGHACASHETCTSGVCGCPTTTCGGVCTDTAHDAMHCGDCATSCARGEYCAAGSCVMATSDWPTLGGGVSRSGLNAGETGRPPLTRAWGLAACANAMNPVVIAEGRVFVTCTSYFAPPVPVSAYDLATGALLWTYDLGDAESVGQPTWADGRVFVAQNKGTASTTNMWAFDADSGRIAWRSHFDSQWETFWAPLVIGGTVYSDGGEYGGLYAWDETGGTQTFFSSVLEQYDEWAPAWDGASVLTFVEGHLRSHDPHSGMVTRTTTVPWDWRGWSMSTMPVVDGGHVFVIAPPSLVAIDATTGAILWTLSHDFGGIPAAADGHVYAVSSGALESRTASTGAIEWTFVGDGALASPTVLTPTHAYVASDSNVYAVDRATGTMVWTAGTGGSLAVGAGHLFVAGSTGTLTAYALTPGS